LEKGGGQAWDDLIARLTAAPTPTDARLLESVRLSEFLHTLRDGMPVTAQNTRNITVAAVSKLARFDGGISATVFF